MDKKTERKRVTEHTSESSIPKGVWRRVRSFPGWWWRGYTSAGKSALCLREHRQLFGLTKTSITRIAKHFQALHRPRQLDAEGAPNMQDFNQVLEHWGIERYQLPQVIRCMQVEIFLYAVMGILATIGGMNAIHYQVPIGIIGAMLILVVSSMVIVCRSWRVRVLCRERFVPFRDWLAGRD